MARKIVTPPGSGTVVPALGDTSWSRPVNQQEQQYFDMRFARALGQSSIGSLNPMWDDATELAIHSLVAPRSVEDVDRALAFSPLPVNTSSPVNMRFARRHPVADLNIPRDPVAVLQVAYRYCYENPFVAKAIKTKTDFLVKDFQHKTHNEKVKAFFDGEADDLNLRMVLRKIGWNLFGIGVCPIWWGGEEGGPIRFIQVLDPRTCHIMHVQGKAKLFIKIDTSMIDAVRDPNGERDIKNKVYFQSLPKYWVKQIQEHISKVHLSQGLIELQEGSYTVVENSYAPMSRSVGSLDGLPLQPAFDALQRYRLLAAGDFAIAWNVKNMITLISEGDPKQEGKDYRPMDDVRMARLQAQFISNPDQSLQVVCDPTTQIRYVIPPIEAFNPVKYHQVEKEIKEVLNLPSFMWWNDGSGAFGATVAELKLLREEVDAIRVILQEQFFRPFYKRLRQGKRGGGFKQDDICYPTYDQNSLREDAIWLTGMQEGYSRGLVSAQTAMEFMGLDYDYEVEQKKKEHDQLGNTSSGEPGQPLNNSPMRPLFEPSQGNLSPVRDKGGNETDHGKGPASGSPRNPRKTGT